MKFWLVAKNSPATLKARNALRAQWKKSIDPATVEKYVIGSCKDCGEIKRRRWTTTFTQTGTPEYRTRCQECDRKFISDQQRRFRKSISRNAKAKKNARKAECIAYLGGNCYRCGYEKSAHALTFHHKSRSEKDRDISSMLDYAWAGLRKELDRCVLVCFNCHMELEEEFRNERARL